MRSLCSNFNSFCRHFWYKSKYDVWFITKSTKSHIKPIVLPFIMIYFQTFDRLKSPSMSWSCKRFMLTIMFRLITYKIIITHKWITMTRLSSLAILMFNFQINVEHLLRSKRPTYTLKPNLIQMTGPNRINFNKEHGICALFICPT